MKKGISLLLSSVMLLGCMSPLCGKAVSEKPLPMKEMTTMELVRDMGVGINLGNTLESCGDWIAQWGDGTVASYETAWGSPVITQSMIQGYANEGFGVVRVPVAWSNLMTEGYTISPEYMERVQKVVDWVIDANMYCIINIHYDNGWVNEFPKDVEGCMYRYTHMWEQICEGFKNYDEHLIFESQNEELGWSSMWNEWGEPKDKEGSYALVNKINQQFVDTVRASGGNNPERHLLISGYNTDIPKTCDSLFKMPSDPKNRCAVSVHYYTPAGFAILEEDADWAKNRTTWGTEDDFKELNYYMDMMKSTFIDNNIPVIIGEYGCPVKNKEPDSVNLFLRSVCEKAYENYLCPIMWDTTGQQYDRETCQLKDRNLAEFFSQYKKAEIETIKGDVNADGTFSVSDVIALQKWLLKSGTSLNKWENADFDGNGVLNIIDLALMKRELLK